MSGLVLIVDDDEALSENLAEIVQELGVRTVIAPDRQSALAQAAAHDFDVALIDVRLPDGDGLSLLGPLRERSPHLQAVMVTGNASVEGAIAAVRGAAFAYVVKPVSAARAARRPPGGRSIRRRLYRERERLRARARRLGATPPGAGRIRPGVRAGAGRGGPAHDLEQRARTRHRLSARRDAGQRRPPLRR